MIDAMKPPVIVDENGSVNVFDSIEAAERYLEPIDVENDEYIAYDSEGRLLKLIPVHPGIRIESAENEPNHKPELHRVLVEFLSHIEGDGDELRDTTLSDLVTRALKYTTK